MEKWKILEFLDSLNRGIPEQEQKGVNAPNSEAKK